MVQLEACGESRIGWGHRPMMWASWRGAIGLSQLDVLGALNLTFAESGCGARQPFSVADTLGFIRGLALFCFFSNRQHDH